jgi:hypothetical protein
MIAIGLPLRRLMANVLRSHDPPGGTGAASSLAPGQLVGVVLAGGFLYGLAMGSWLGDPRQMMISAVKVPLLVLGAALVAVPAAFMATVVLGLADSFAVLARGVLTAQATLAITLVSLAPITVLQYLGGLGYSSALLFNGAIFAVATVAAQWRLRTLLADYLRERPRRRIVLRIWLGLYWFIAIELAWILRPYIGSPGLPPTFFRADSFGNAYEVLFELMLGAFRG